MRTGKLFADQRRKFQQVRDHVIQRQCAGNLLPAWVIPAHRDPGVDAALHIAGQRVADEQAVFLGDAGNVGKDIIEIELVRLFIADA